MFRTGGPAPNGGFCRGISVELLNAFYNAQDEGCAFNCFIAPPQSARRHFGIPRFREGDFQRLIVEMGGAKIPESTGKTRDFMLENVALELKDLQKESLFDKERRKSIGRLFAKVEAHTINLDPNFDYGDPTVKSCADPKHHSKPFQESLGTNQDVSSISRGRSSRNNPA